MGEIIRVFVPACRIRELFLTGTKAQLISIYADLDSANEDCTACRNAGMITCPYKTPRILALDVAEELNELYYDVGS